MTSTPRWRPRPTDPAPRPAPHAIAGLTEISAPAPCRCAIATGPCRVCAHVTTRPFPVAPLRRSAMPAATRRAPRAWSPPWQPAMAWGAETATDAPDDVTQRVWGEARHVRASHKHDAAAFLQRLGDVRRRQRGSRESKVVAPRYEQRQASAHHPAHRVGDLAALHGVEVVDPLAGTRRFRQRGPQVAAACATAFFLRGTVGRGADVSIVSLHNR